MTLLASPLVVESLTPPHTGPSQSARRAEANAEANAMALARSQPALGSALPPEPVGVVWMLARDGSLTATRDGKWWGGNSLPARSARAMLKGVDGSVAVSCVVAPVHAAQVRALLEQVDAPHALIVVQPDLASLAVALRCEDFSEDMLANRLWWAVGANWEAQLDELLTTVSGLPVPGRFVRTPDVDDAVAGPVLTAAQAIFGRHMTSRAARIASLREAGVRAARCVTRILVVGPSRFRLWSGAPRVVAETMLATTPQQVAASWELVDTDDPTSASPLAVAEAASRCDAIVTADTARCDSPSLLPIDLPWVTWVTTSRIPSFEGAGPNDRLLLADPVWRAQAVAAGWPASSTAVAGWPDASAFRSTSGRSTSVGAGPVRLALLADVGDMSPPAFAEEFSSHRLAWEGVRDELTRNPFALGVDVNRYLDARLQSAGVDPSTVDRAAFIEKLVLPAYAVGVAAELLEAQVPLTIHGKGWETTACRDHARGPVRSRAEFDAIVSSATALVRPWPFTFAHEIDAVGRPVVTAGGSRESFRRAVRDALEARPTIDDERPTLTASSVLCCKVA